VLRYLKKTAELRLKFGNSVIRVIEAINKVKGYINNNYVSNVSNKKSIINYVFFIN